MVSIPNSQQPVSDTTSLWDRIDIKDLTIKLADFGCSRIYEELTKRHLNTMTLRGTSAFMAPEVKGPLESDKRMAPYNHTVDIYSSALCSIVLFVKRLTTNGVAQ